LHEDSKTPVFNLHWVKVQLTETWSTFPSGLEPERYLEDLDMFRGRVCGPIGQTPTSVWDL